MKFRLCLVFLFTYCFSALAQEADIKQLKIKKTKEHVNVAGTNLYLKVPEGYEQSITYVGWYKKDGPYIVITKRPRSFTDVSAEIDQQVINSGDIFLPGDKELLKLNRNDAIYFKTKNGAVEKQFLVIKATDFTYVIEVFGSEDMNENQTLKGVVLSAFIKN